MCKLPLPTLALVITIALSSIANAAPGVDVGATTDTVMKIKYTGGTPTSTTHPALSVEGKILGINVQANNSSNAKAIVGQVTGYALPNSSTYKVGVKGAGDYGVMGKGTTGVSGEGAVYGVFATGNGSSGTIGLYASGAEMAAYLDGDVYVAGEVNEGSDRALKENIRPLDRGLATVLALRPKAYEMKPGMTQAKLTGTRFGLIAQEMQPLLPELVKMVKTQPKMMPGGKVDANAPRPEFLSVNYDGLIPVLINAIQEQQAQIEALKQEVQRLGER